MEKMHSLLKRQLKRHLKDIVKLGEKEQGFIEAVSNAYYQFDADRNMLERSLELSSQELLQANSEMRAIFQAFPDIFFRLDNEGKIVDYKSGSTSDMYLSPEKLIGKLIYDIPIKNVKRKFQKAIHKVKKTNSIVSIEYSLMIQKRERFYEARLLPILENQIFVIIRDITNRKEAERALRESEEKFRNIFEASPMGIHMYQLNSDNQLIFIDANLASDKIMEIDSKKSIGKTLEEAFPKLAETEVPERYRLAAAQGEACHRDQIIYEDNQVRRAYEVHAFQTSPGKMVALFLDITDRMQAEEQRKKLQEQLTRAERMESLGVLAGGVAHDLNNILGPLVAYPEIIKMKLHSGGTIKEYITKIEKSAQRAAEVVQDLLTMARRGRYEMMPVKLNEIVDSYLQSPDFLDLKQRNPTINIEIDLKQNIPNINGSVPHLSKAFMNLIINAYEAMPHGGNISIKTECMFVDKPLKGYDNIEKGHYITLSIKDTGIGIDKKEYIHIFEPFYTKKAMGRSGSGLGLAVVYGVIKDHNGYIDVKSEKNQGSEFIIYLPSIEGGITKRKTTLMDIRGSEKILVVDDVIEQRELATTILSNLGYNVEMVPGGKEAVEFCKRKQVDVVVLDMIMEDGFDGLDTYREIIKLHPGQKAIITSGFSETNRVKEAEKLGVGKFVSKPYTMQFLGEAIREVVKK